MENVYIYINELREQLDGLIEDNYDDLNNPKVIDLSEKLDKLIVYCMLEQKDSAS